MKKLVISALCLFNMTAPAISVTAGEEPILEHKTDNPEILHKPEISDRTKRLVKKYEDQIKAGKLKEINHKSADGYIRVAVYVLKRRGHKKEASDLWKEWKLQRREEYERATNGQYSISDFLETGRDPHIGEIPGAAISEWLHSKMQMLTFLLGETVMYNTHLSDIESFNLTPRVVFGCYSKASLLTYSYHLTEDPGVKIRSLGPVSIYWVVEISCLTASSGTFFLCGPLAEGSFYLSKKFLFPRLNEPLWKLSCKQ